VANIRICCPCCKTSLRVPKALRQKRACHCPRCQAALLLHSADGKTTALLVARITHVAPQQGPTAPERVAPVGETAVDVPTSLPTRWDLQAWREGA
jgi:hypothetical protein